MQYTFICYPRCTTCQKARKWLDEKKAEYVFRDISRQNPTADELREWIRLSGLPVKRFFNTSGLLYKELNLKVKLGTMSEEDSIALLATNGMLVKRPILIGDGVLVGFDAQKWGERII